MSNITTPFAGTETTAQTQAKLSAIANYWSGTSTALSGAGSWGAVRAILNNFANAANQINNYELASSFITKLNWLNDSDNMVAPLFANNEQGVWYDPSDMTTLFQDSFGTTPVTAVEQPVGLMLDKSKGLTFANGLKRVNLLGTTDLIDGAGRWTGANATRTTITASNPISTTSVSKITLSSTSVNEKVWFTVMPPTVVAASYKTSIYAKADTASWIYLRCDNGTAAGVYFNLANGTKGTEDSGAVGAIQSAGDGWYLCSVTRTLSAGSGYGALQLASGDGGKSFAGTVGDAILVCGIDLRLASEASNAPTPYQRIDATWYDTMPGNHATQATPSARPVLSARVNLLTATTTLATQNVTTVAVNYTLRFTGAGSITLSGTATGSYNAGTHTITCTAGTLTLTVSGTVTDADLRVTNDTNIPTYQRVNTSTDYDTTGFPMYLRFDGSDDAMVTGSIDFTSTDEMTVFAGVRKPVDASTLVIAELSTQSGTTNGTFGVFTANSGGSYSFSSRGTGLSVASTGSYSAAQTNVITAFGDISGDVATLRVNGSQAGTSATDQGTGNYGNYPLFIGSRNQASLRFNGRLYSLIVRGAATSAAQIQQTETYINARTGAY